MDFDVLAVKRHVRLAAVADATEAGLTPVVLSSYKGVMYLRQDSSVGLTLVVRRLNFDGAPHRFLTFHMSLPILIFFILTFTSY
jgi:hypothetical protein